MAKGSFTATIGYNKRIGKSFYKIGLEFSGASAEVFADVKPGQFVEIDLCHASLPADNKIPGELCDSAGRNIILRRPFSFSDIAVEKGKTTVEILYCTVGPASLRMSNLEAGDSVSVIGPLGNGFGMPEGKTTALLVLGGTGAGPIIHLAKQLKNYPQIQKIAFVGARSVEDLPFEKIADCIGAEGGDYLAEFSGTDTQTFVSTDDGSVGSKGFVTDILYRYLKQSGVERREIMVYACGPEPMLARVAQIAESENIDCQVSLERRMACGIGLCQSCAVECKAGDSGQSIYKMCCKDGPVFDASEVVF
ncbi:MAG: dihydroorotate dehydrogenase electron transfer subunit [Phycisphaerae bacterium]|nr:dihydroorotate dehydrogenase electron transfer subunit [Phycisphaerae bacterium]